MVNEKSKILVLVEGEKTDYKLMDFIDGIRRKTILGFRKIAATWQVYL